MMKFRVVFLFVAIFLQTCRSDPGALQVEPHFGKEALTALNHATNDYLNLKMRYALSEVCQLRSVAQVWKGLVRDGSWNVLDSFTRQLQTMEDEFLHQCNLTRRSAWTTCRLDTMEICSGEMANRCRNMSETELWGFLESSLPSDPVPDLFSVLQLSNREKMTWNELKAARYTSQILPSTSHASSTLAKLTQLEQKAESLKRIIATFLQIAPQEDPCLPEAMQVNMTMHQRILSSMEDIYQDKKRSVPNRKALENIFLVQKKQNHRNGSRSGDGSNSAISNVSSSENVTSSAQTRPQISTKARERNTGQELASTVLSWFQQLSSRRELMTSQRRNNFLQQTINFWRTVKKNLLRNHNRQRSSDPELSNMWGTHPRTLQARLETKFEARHESRVPRSIEKQRRATNSDFRQNFQIQSHMTSSSNGTHNVTVTKFSATVTKGKERKTFDNLTSWLNSEEHQQFKNIFSDEDDNDIIYNPVFSTSVPSTPSNNETNLEVNPVFTFTLKPIKYPLLSVENVPSVKFEFPASRNNYGDRESEEDPLPEIRFPIPEIPAVPVFPNPWGSISDDQPVVNVNQFHATVSDNSGTHEFTNRDDYLNHLARSRQETAKMQLNSVNRILGDLEQRLSYWKKYKNNVHQRRFQNTHEREHRDRVQQRPNQGPPHRQGPLPPPPPPLPIRMPQFPSMPEVPIFHTQQYQQWMPSFHHFRDPLRTYRPSHYRVSQEIRGHSSPHRMTIPMRTTQSRWSSATRRGRGRRPSTALRRRRPTSRSRRQAGYDTRNEEESCNHDEIMEDCVDLVARSGRCMRKLETACSPLTSRRREFARLLQAAHVMYQTNLRSLKKIENEIEKFVWFEEVTDAPRTKSIVVESIHERQSVDGDGDLIIGVQFFDVFFSSVTIPLQDFVDLPEQIVERSEEKYKQFLRYLRHTAEK